MIKEKCYIGRNVSTYSPGMKYPENRYAQGERPAHIGFPEVQVNFLRGIL